MVCLILRCCNLRFFKCVHMNLFTHRSAIYVPLIKLFWISVYALMFGLLGRTVGCFKIKSSPRFCISSGPATHLGERIKLFNIFVGGVKKNSDSDKRYSSTLVNSTAPSAADFLNGTSEPQQDETINNAIEGNSEAPDKMTNFCNNYVLIKAPEEADKINITVHWSGRVINLDRQKDETLKTVITRLKRSLQKHIPPPRVHVHEMTNPYLMCISEYTCWKDAEICSTTDAQDEDSSDEIDTRVVGKRKLRNFASMNDEYNIQFMNKMFNPYEETETLEEAAKDTSFLSINGTILQVYKNVFRLLEVTTGPKVMVGCPVSFTIRSDGPWRHEDIHFEWIGGQNEVLKKDSIFLPTEAMRGKRVKVKLSHKQLMWNTVESSYSEIVDMPKNRWLTDRIDRFNHEVDSTIIPPIQCEYRDIRVMSFNILSPTYVATEEAMERFFPYCKPEWFDSAYRNPMILREILMVNPQVLCLQECSSSTYREYLEPILGKMYHSWLTIKSTASDEGCCMLVHKNVFEVKEVTSLVFKDEIRKPEYQRVLKRIGAEKWLNYDLDTYFSRYHTVFQMGCFKNILDSKKNYLFLVNTHLYFHPHGRHIRLLQTYVMLNELERFKRKCAVNYGFNVESECYTLICGDFNSFNTEGVFQLMNFGWIPIDHADFQYGMKHVHEKFNPSEHSRTPETPKEIVYYPLDPKIRLEASNCEGYQDAYRNTHLPFTNFVKTFYGTLDYIFHSRNVKPKRCMPGISKANAEEYEGLPSKIYPSDHISIAADF